MRIILIKAPGEGLEAERPKSDVCTSRNSIQDHVGRLIGKLSLLVCVNRHKLIFKSFHSGIFLIELSPPASNSVDTQAQKHSNHGPTLSDVHHLERKESQGTNLVQVK